ncbi:MAG: 6-phosphofructokinase [Lachnospiraceae bacterium]|nr:6-phosphofructokinase [Lachnospiraceae bacterium]
MAEKLIGSAIFGQSGGPTSVINSSAYGVIRTALDSDEITNVYGAENGIIGVLNDRLFDMSKEDADELLLLVNTPSSELGSCRYKIADPDEDDTDYKKILKVFKKYNVRYFFYNGGNDSMDTCNKIYRYMKKVGYECRVIGVPKTIDNDLSGTDHCPGYGSAAKYIATSCMEVSKDNKVYTTDNITVMEIMGRHAGWLTAASVLASDKGEGPDLIYLPETDFDLDQFFDDVQKVHEKKGDVFIAVSEGIHYDNGRFVAEVQTSTTDGFGHAQLGGVANYLGGLLKARTGIKTRAIELSLLQRSAAHMASKTDIEEAIEAGKFAVKSALAGKTGRMVAFERDPDSTSYKCKMILVPLSEAANAEKKVPREWINKRGNFVNKEFLDYALPLIQGEPVRYFEDSLPRYARLKKVIAEK